VSEPPEEGPTPLVLNPFNTHNLQAACQLVGQLVERCLPDGTRVRVVVGDVSGDGYVDEEDLELLRFLLSDTEEARRLLRQLSPAQLMACDVDGDGCVGVYDLLVLCVRLMRDLKILSVTDELTRLDNRRAFKEKAALKLNTARRYGVPVCCMALDIDLFKDINDTYGHEVGDAALVRLATILRQATRDSDVVCRYGGDEFILLLDHAELAQGRTVARRICEALARDELLTPEGVPVRLSVSIGLASYHPGQDLAGLLRAADQALYGAKRKGRGGIGLSSSEAALA
jgi:diguanylate cyclase (GGDEF)-like protein